MNDQDKTKEELIKELQKLKQENNSLKTSHQIDIAEHKLAAKLISDNAKDLEDAQKLAKIGSWKSDITTNTVEWSAELCRINGYDPKLPTPSFSEMSRFYTPKSRNRLNVAVTNAFNKGEPYELELEQVRTDGTIFHTTSRGVPDYDDSGKMIGLHGTVQDITERKQAEEEILRHSKELATLLRISQEFATTLDLAKILQMITDRATELTKLKSSAIYLLEGETLRLWATTPPLPPQFPDELRNAPLADHPHIRETITTGLPVFLFDTATADLTAAERAVCEVRSLRSILYLPLHFGTQALGVLIVTASEESHKLSGEEINLFNTFANLAAMGVGNARLYESQKNYAREQENLVDELKQTEEARIKSERRYLDLFSQANEGLLLMTPEGQLSDLNQAFAEMHGYTVDELKNYDIRKLDVLGDKTLENRADRIGCILAGEVVRFEVEHYHKDGHIFPLSVTVSSISIDDQQFFLAFHQDITERNKSSELLKISEERYRLINDASLDQIYSYDLENRFMSANKVLCANLRLSAEEVIGKSYWEFGFPEAQCREWDELHRQVYAFGSKMETVSTPMPDGTIHYFEVNLSLIHDGAGKVIGIAGVNRNITERKRAEEKQKESEKKFRNLVWDMSVGVLLQGPQAEMLMSNPAALELLGLTEDQLLGKTSFDPYWNVIHEDGSPFPGQTHPVPTAIAEGRSVRNVIMGVDRPEKKDRVWLLVSAIPQFDEKGKVQQVVCTFINITDRKKAELLLKDKNEEIETQNIELFQRNDELRRSKEKAEESDEKFQAYTQMSPIAIYTTDENGDCIYANSKWLEIAGLSLEESRGKGWIKALHPDDKDYIFENWYKSVQSNGSWNFEYRFMSPQGKITYVEGNAKPLYNKVNKLIGYLGSNVDINQRKNIELELIKAKEKAEESDRLKSAFLANMSHEIRTPMNGILGFAELLKEPDLSGEQQQEYIRIIEKSGARMLNIINDIVDISKIEAGLMKLEMNESNINEQIEYIYTFFKPEMEAKGIKFSLKNTLPAKEAIIKTDREKLYAILTNLVKNAIKYTEKGSIEFGYFKKGDHLEFYVKDTGIGVKKDRQEAIFERFIQADIEDKSARQGAGLGLAITKAYVEMLGGKIWIESREGIGSTFYFTLPYNAEPLIETIDQQIVPSGKTDNVRKLKILIVEDDKISEMFIDVMVKTFGKEILKVGTGVEAVEACRDNPDIDLILMDIQMAEMGGYEATRQIRQFNKEVVIIAQTAFGLSGDREKAIEAGCNDYISKPINKNELLALIQKYFGK